MNSSLKKLIDNRFFNYVYIILCSIAIAFTCTNTPVNIGNIGTDSAVFNYIARVIMAGGIPYRDSFDHKGPILYLIDVIGLCIDDDIGVWIIELICMFCLLVFTYKMAKLLGCDNLKSSVLILICVFTIPFYLDGGNTTEEYGCVFVMNSLYVFLKYFLKGTINRFEVLICGMSFGIVCLLRINMVALWVVMCTGVVVECIRKRAYSKVVRYSLLFIIGTTIVIGPIILWLVRNGSLQQFIRDYFEFNLMYTSDSERASLNNILQSLNYFLLSGPIILSLLIIIYYCIRKRCITDWLCGAVLLLSLITMCISGQVYDHYGMILVPVVIYAFSRLLAEVVFIKKNALFIMVGICVFLLLYLKGFKKFSEQFLNMENMAQLDEIANIIKSNTNENDKISVCGNKDILYLKSERFSASIYSYQDPIANIDMRIKEKYIEDLQSLSAVIIVIDETSLWHREIDNILNENYRKIKQINTEEIFLLKQ